jgi:hypothetical protein
MIITILTHIDRLPYLQKTMGTRLTDVVDDENDLVKVTLEINNSIDVMNIFHAGISFGLDAMSKSRTKLV